MASLPGPGRPARLAAAGRSGPVPRHRTPPLGFCTPRLAGALPRLAVARAGPGACSALCQERACPPPPPLTAPLCPALVFPSVTIHREWLPGLCPRPPGPGHPPTLCAPLTGTSSSGRLPGAPACDWSSRGPQCPARHGLCSRGSAVAGGSEKDYRGERAAAQGRVSGAKPRPHQRLGVSAPRGLVRKVGPVSSPVAF